MVVRSAGETHRTRLRAFLSLLFDEPHLGANMQLGEARVEDAVLMKIDLPAVGSLDKPVPFVGKQLGLTTQRWGFMRLYD